MAANKSSSASNPTYTWINKCGRCNGGPEPHDSQACCISCRNFDDIDTQAKLYKLDSLLSSNDWIADTMKAHRVAMDDCQNRIKAAHDAKVSATAAVKDQVAKYKTANQLRLDAFQAFIKAKLANDPQLQALERALKDAEGACEATFRDLASLQKVDADAAKKEDASRSDLMYHQGLAEKMVEQIAFRLLQVAKINAADQISRARFFFTWIANSLWYNKDVMEKTMNLRTPLHTLQNGYEVCAGYAELFELMFNSVPAGKTFDQSGLPENYRFIYISGNAKQGAEGAPNAENAHAWNAFPVAFDGNGKPTSWKVMPLK